MKLRPALVLAHRWFGLAGAVWLFLLGLSGAILVFYTELDHALNPALFATRGGGVSVTYDQAIAAVEASRPGRQVTSFWTQADPTGAWTFRVSDPGREAAPEVSFDPTAGAVLGERVWDELRLDRPHLMPLLYRFHYSLLFGAPGEWLLGLVGFLWLLDHIVSAVLSFPAPRRWAESFRIRWAGGHKLTFDLHRAVGLWLLPVTLIVAVSGTYMNWRPYAEALVGAFSTRSAWPGTDLPPLPQPVAHPPLSFGQAIARSGAARPQGAVYDPERGLYSVSAFDSRDLSYDYGQLYTVVDGRSGQVLSRTHVATGSAADIIDAWQLPLHSGKVLGWPGRILVALSGVALCAFVVTGLLLWSRKRRARRTRAQRAGPSVGEGRPNVRFGN